MSVPVPRLSASARVGVVFLLLSGCVSWRHTETEDGRVVLDLDYGGGGMALVALILLLYAAGKAGSMDDERRGQRLTILYGLATLAFLRMWAAVGCWPL